MYTGELPGMADTARHVPPCDTLSWNMIFISLMKTHRQENTVCDYVQRGVHAKGDTGSCCMFHAYTRVGVFLKK